MLYLLAFIIGLLDDSPLDSKSSFEVPFWMAALGGYMDGDIDGINKN